MASGRRMVQGTWIRRGAQSFLKHPSERPFPAIWRASIFLTHTYTPARNGDNVTKTTPIQGSTFFEITRQCNYIGGVEAAENDLQNVQDHTAPSSAWNAGSVLLVSELEVELDAWLPKNLSTHVAPIQDTSSPHKDLKADPLTTPTTWSSSQLKRAVSVFHFLGSPSPFPGLPALPFASLLASRKQPFAGTGAFAD